MKLSRNNANIYSRCAREIVNSTNRQMFRVALTYASLFVRKLEREGVDTTEVLNTINYLRKGIKNRLGL